MIILREKQVICDQCNTLILVREYEGLEGAWYTDHLDCKQQEKTDEPSIQKV